jgi:hypothetical protein
MFLDVIYSIRYLRERESIPTCFRSVVIVETMEKRGLELDEIHGES